jgi:hypothetical protein
LKGNYSSLVRTKSTYGIEEKVASTEKLNRVGLSVKDKGRQTKQKSAFKNYDKLLNEDQKALDENQKLYPERSLV